MEADKRKDYESMVAKITEFIDRGSRRHVWARWSDKQFYEGRILEDIREKHLCRVSFPDVSSFYYFNSVVVVIVVVFN